MTPTRSKPWNQRPSQDGSVCRTRFDRLHVSLIRAAFAYAGVISIVGFLRPVVVVVGALVTLQASDSFDIGKIVFLVASTIAFVGSVRYTVRGRSSELVTLVRPVLIASIAIGIIVGISFPVAMVHGTPPTQWLRDASAYGLVVMAPWLALDIARSMRPRLALAFFVSAASLGTVSFWLTWTQRRGLADLPIDRLTLPSFTLATALFALTVALAVSGPRNRYLWSLAGCLTIGLLLLTGTRSTFAILVVPIAILVSEARIRGGAAARLGVIPGVLPIVLAVAYFLSTQGLQFQTPGSNGRSPEPTGPSATAPVGSVPSVTGTPGGGTTAEPGDGIADRFDIVGDILSGRDPSLQGRIAQTRAAWDIFVTSPILGAGLGVTVSWTDSQGVLIQRFTADTPVLVLAKFGVMGLVMIAFLGASAVALIRSLGRLRPTSTAARLALVGFTVGILALTPFGWQVEDKGTGLALIALLGYVLASAREPLESREDRDARTAS